MAVANSGEVISALASDSLGNVAAGTENEKDGPGDAAIYLWYACVAHELAVTVLRID